MNQNSRSFSSENVFTVSVAAVIITKIVCTTILRLRGKR